MLVGRDTEQRAVEALLGEARAGTAGAVLLVGLPGIGKTSLLAHAETVAAAAGMTVWRVTAVEAESGISGSGLSLLAVQSGIDTDTLVSPWGLLSALTAAGTDAPLLLALDDVQWLDDASLIALDFALRRLQDDAVAVIMTARPEIGDRQELAEVRRIAVEPLGDDDAGRVVAAASPSTPPDVALQIARALGNVPLALVEAAALLPVDVLTGRAPVLSPLPVGRSITARYARGIDGLPDATRRALVIASASDSGSAAVLAAALETADLSPDDMAPAIEAGLVVLDGTFRFRHPLVRSAVHAAARDGERRDAHRILASVAADQDDEDSRLRHASAAAVGPDEALAAGLEARAPVVAERRGHAAAAAGLERAAELSPRLPDRWRRLVSSIELARSDPRSARHARDVLEQCADPALRARAALILADEHLPLAEGAALLEDVIRDLPRGPLAETIVSIRARLAMHQLDLDGLDRVEHLLDAWEAAEPLAWQSVAMLGEIATFRGHHAEAVSRMRRAIADSADLDPDEVPLHVMFDWVIAPNYLGDLGMASPAVASRRAAATRRWRRTQDPLWFALDDMLACEVARRTGSYALSEAVARTALGYGPVLGMLRGGILSRLVQVLASMGREAEARVSIDELDTFSQLVEMPWEGLWSAHARGLLDLLHGRSGDAVTSLSRFDGITFLGRGVRDAIANGLVLLVEAHAATGDRAEALRVAHDLARWLDGAVDPLAPAFVERAFALADDGDVDAHFTAAAVMHRTTDDPYELARTLLLHGEWLRRNQRPADSRVLLREAADTFSRLGADPWVKRALRELAASGETRSHVGTTSSVDLTPQELRIAVAVSEGMSNTEIASSVFLSVKTIETHLTRIYRKLGVRSRGGVARALDEADLSPLTP